MSVGQEVCTIMRGGECVKRYFFPFLIISKSLKSRLASFRAHTVYIDPNKVEGEEEEEETKKTKGKKKGKKKKEEEVQETPAVRLDSEEFWSEMFGKDALLLRLDSQRRVLRRFDLCFEWYDIYVSTCKTLEKRCRERFCRDKIG